MLKDGSAALLARIMEATGGNPFFAIELARSRRDLGRASPPCARADLRRGWTLPRSLRLADSWAEVLAARESGRCHARLGDAASQAISHS